jgi:hypothetical protein
MFNKNYSITGCRLKIKYTIKFCCIQDIAATLETPKALESAQKLLLFERQHNRHSSEGSVYTTFSFGSCITW